MRQQPIPITGYENEQAANAAWAKHRALERAYRDAPALADDPRFVTLRSEATAAWLEAFGGLE